MMCNNKLLFLLLSLPISVHAMKDAEMKDAQEEPFSVEITPEGWSALSTKQQDEWYKRLHQLGVEQRKQQEVDQLSSTLANVSVGPVFYGTMEEYDASKKQ